MLQLNLNSQIKANESDISILGGIELAEKKQNQSEDKKFNAENTVKNMERTNRNPYERTKVAVYATGNRWAIENFEATHN